MKNSDWTKTRTWKHSAAQTSSNTSHVNSQEAKKWRLWVFHLQWIRIVPNILYYLEYSAWSPSLARLLTEKEMNLLISAVSRNLKKSFIKVPQTNRSSSRTPSTCQVSWKSVNWFVSYRKKTDRQTSVGGNMTRWLSTPASLLIHVRPDSHNTCSDWCSGVNKRSLKMCFIGHSDLHSFGLRPPNSYQFILESERM